MAGGEVVVDSLEEIQLQASGDRTFIKKKKREEVMAPFANPCGLHKHTVAAGSQDSWSGILRSVGTSE